MVLQQTTHRQLQRRISKDPNPRWQMELRFDVTEMQRKPSFITHMNQAFATHATGMDVMQQFGSQGQSYWCLSR